MAKKPTAAASTEVANWDEELAKLANVSTGLTNSSEGGRFFSTKAGVLAYDETPMPGNQMCVIIGAWCLENVYYEGVYDANERSGPTCFAFCKDPDGKDEMGPVAKDLDDPAFEQQSDLCANCEKNQWGSAETGRGKACGNRRRLACLPAGTYTSKGKNSGFELEVIEDEDHFRSAEPVYLKVPVMSGKGFDSYVKQVAEMLKRPTWAVYTRIYLEPDAKSQFRVMFELIEQVDNSLLKTLMAKSKMLTDGVDFPYTPFTEDDAPAAKGGGRQSSAKKLGKPAAKKR